VSQRKLIFAKAARVMALGVTTLYSYTHQPHHVAACSVCADSGSGEQCNVTCLDTHNRNDINSGWTMCVPECTDCVESDVICT